MAGASIAVDQDQFSCSICQDLLKDPVTIPCGHSYCMGCIKDCWDQDDHTGVYSCPQCRQTFTPRPVLNRNILVAKMVEELKKTGLQAAPPAHCYTGPGDEACDVCTGRKLKAVKSCLVCLASYCETHLKLHNEISLGKRHKLIDASGHLQEKICSHHDKLLEVYCRTDQQCICYLCTMDEHKGHDTVSAAAEWTEKQKQLGVTQRRCQQRIQEREKELQDLRQAVQSYKKLKKTGLQAAPPALCYSGPGDVACDVCTGRKLKAIKSCLVCLASYCETHLKLHNELNPGKRHKLIDATGNLQEKICSHHDKLLEIYCRTDQQCICYLCTMDEHKGHDTVSAAAERTEKQKPLDVRRKRCLQRIQEREKELQDLRQAVQSLTRSAQAAVEDSERIFTELIRSIERRRSEVKELIRDQEKAAVSWAEGLLERLEQEIAELRRRDAELEQLSHTEDHIHFLQCQKCMCCCPWIPAPEKSSCNVACDVCTGRKLKAVKSCLVCQVSYCETHLQPHYESPAFKKHKLVQATENLQEKICSHHDKLLEVYCRTDQQCICYLCTMDEHKGHDIVSAAEERAEKQKKLGSIERQSEQRIQERKEELQDLRRILESLTRSAQTAVEDSERIFTQFMRRRRSEVKELIRDKEKALLSEGEGLLERLEQEIADLRRRDAELEQLSHTEDHIYFLQPPPVHAVCDPER
ncbi:hypothetical protein JZ751_007630 [Albula glossodonta]|uniref:E3 ubiquitin/ISG15 ligase TRIM25-like n=1 Tax=Albula glossodonta TaxID=121402 RepID=A0A8T2ML29_9TELE|nr:hypothetical protein JZ751_007630 [Albula glossodonta]